MNKLFAGAAAVAALAFAAPSMAVTYYFELTGDYTASWELDSSPTPDAWGSGVGFALYDVPGFPDALYGVTDIYFWDASIGGGLEIDDYYGGVTLVSTDGPQLYTGSASAPTFVLGTYSLTQYQGTGTYTLTISDPSVAPGVPEAATWALMIAGFGLTGSALRRRKQEELPA